MNDSDIRKVLQNETFSSCASVEQSIASIQPNVSQQVDLGLSLSNTNVDISLPSCSSARPTNITDNNGNNDSEPKPKKGKFVPCNARRFVRPRLYVSSSESALDFYLDLYLYGSRLFTALAIITKLISLRTVIIIFCLKNIFNIVAR